MAFWAKRKRRKNNKQSKSPVSAVTCESIRVMPSNYQHIGSRKNQEDAFALSDLEDEEFVKNNGVLAVVADGMGGLAMGEEAGKVAVSSFLDEYLQKPPHETIPQTLAGAIQVANSAVCELSYSENFSVEVGTTLVAAVIHKDQLHWISAGDSRIYHFRNKTLSRLNKEHIYANQLDEDVLNDRITRNEADTHPERNALTSFLGMPELPEIDRCEEPLLLEPGDIVMLCSDGLYNVLPDHEIVDILQGETADLAELLVRHSLSKQKPHQDNITVIVLYCQPNPT